MSVAGLNVRIPPNLCARFPQALLVHGNENVRPLIEGCTVASSGEVTRADLLGAPQ